MYEPSLFEAPNVDDPPEAVVDRDGLATYDRYFIDPTRADFLLHALLAKVKWSQDFLNMYGKRIPFPRLTAWYGDAEANYTYSGIQNKPHAWNAELREIRDEIRRRTNVHFNSVLLNQYRNGNDSLSWHSDNERELGEMPVIASVSLGVSRTFDLKHREDGALISLKLDHGSLLLMSGALQHRWVHRVRKEKSISGTRINLTFRVVDAGLRTKRCVSPTRAQRVHAGDLRARHNRFAAAPVIDVASR